MSTRNKKLRYAGAYITAGRHRALTKLAKDSNRSLAQYARHIFDAVITGKIEVPDSIPEPKEAKAA